MFNKTTVFSIVTNNGTRTDFDINSEQLIRVTKKALYKSLICGAHTVFKPEEEEYEFIQEYGRGIWDVDRNKKYSMKLTEQI